MAESRTELLERVRNWHRDLPSPAPHWSDVELVTRLAVRDASVLRQLLLADLDRLATQWDGFLAVTAAGATPEPTPEPTPDRTPVPAIDPTDGLAPRAARRYRELKGWITQALADGKEVDAVTDDQLVAIAGASSDTPAIKRVPQLRNFRAELEKLLTQPLPPPAAHATPAVQRTPAAVDSPSTQPPSELVPPDREPSVTAGRILRGPAALEPFAPFEWAQTTGEAVTSGRVEVDDTGEDSMRLTWLIPEPDATVRIYRVVTRDDYLPQAPEMGDVVAVTYDGEATDTKPFASLVRHVTVWLNEGASESAARSAQPTLHAAGVAVLPIRGFEVRAERDTVIGRWDAGETVRRVDVFRIPLQLAQANPRRRGVGLELSPLGISQGGFRDTEVPPGDWEYRVFAAAHVLERDVFAPSVARIVRVDAIAQRITNLEVTPREDSDNYDLTFTYPSHGRVEIYRRDVEPPGDIGARLITRPALVAAGFTPLTLLPQQLDREGAEGHVRDVAWPAGDSKAYFTPVTVLDDDHIQVGDHAILARAEQVTFPRIVERVDEQFLTFAWPAGVDSVRIYQGASGSTTVALDQAELHELTEDDYRRLCGAHLEHPLSPEGCAVHLVSTAYINGEPVYSDPVTVDYPGLVRVVYQLVPVELPGRKRGETLATTLRKVQVRSTAASPPGTGHRLALVHNARRLPLHAGDGQEVQARQVSFVAGVPVDFIDQVDLAGRTGYLRLFVEPAPGQTQTLAVLDPPLGQLRCS